MALGMQQTASLSRPAACAARGPRRSHLAAPSRAATYSGVRRLRCVARAAAASAHGATQRWQSPLPLPPLPLRAHAAALALSLALCALPAAAAPPPPPPEPAPFVVRQALPAARLTAQLSGVVTLGGEAYEKDPVQPFTLYGTIYKKFLIERLQGEKIVSREKGVTATACVSAVREAAETPDVVGLPMGLKATRAKVQPSCASVALPGKFERIADIRPACAPACRTACSAALEAHATLTRATTGYALAADDSEKLGKQCTRVCGVECTKPGKAFDFALPWRP